MHCLGVCAAGGAWLRGMHDWGAWLGSGVCVAGRGMRGWGRAWLGSPPPYGWPAGGAQPTGMMPCYFGLNFVELCLFRKKETALFM